MKYNKNLKYCYIIMWVVSMMSVLGGFYDN